MNPMYRDMAENYPDIFAHQLKSYQDDRNSDWNRPPLTPINYFSSRRATTSTLQKSARRSASIRKRHLLERFANYDEIPTFPQRDKPLVLYFYGSENFGYIATPKGTDCYFVVEVQDKKGKLVYEAQLKRANGGVIKRATRDTVGSAIAALCAQKWAVFTAWNRAYNLYSFYKAIHFWFSDNKSKQPRNNTRTIKMPKHYRRLF